MLTAEVLSDQGSGPALLYLPGIDGSGELLLDTAGRLAADFRLVRLRYRHEPSPSASTYAGLASSISDCIDEFGLDRPLVLAESFGVAVGLRLALDAPKRVAGLALVNGFAYFEPRLRLAFTRLVARGIPQPVFDAGRNLFAPVSLFGHRHDEAALRAFRERTATTFDAAYRERLDMIDALDLRPELPRLEQPVALFAADEDRVVASVRAARDMYERLSDATLEILPRAGHLVLPLAEEPWVQRLQILAARSGISPPPDTSRAS